MIKGMYSISFLLLINIKRYKKTPAEPKFCRGKLYFLMFATMFIVYESS